MSHSKQKISANLFNQFFILFDAPKHKQKRIPFTYYNDVAVLVMLINATLEEDILESLFIITQKSYKKYDLLSAISRLKNKMQPASFYFFLQEVIFVAD